MKYIGENALEKLLTLIKNKFISQDDTISGTVINVVPSTQKIAGVDLQDDITATELRTALNIADGANNYTLPVATSEALGGIKSGGDISISNSGDVTVNDNSHNHIISNIDGLQTAIEDKISNPATKSTNQFLKYNGTNWVASDFPITYDAIDDIYTMDAGTI